MTGRAQLAVPGWTDGRPGTGWTTQQLLPAWDSNRCTPDIRSQFCEFETPPSFLHPVGKVITEPMMLSKQYQETARTLLRVAGSMSDQTIADRLKAVAENYELRAVKASRKEADKPLPVSARGEAGEAPGSKGEFGQ
jgi:hypothetical protein